MRFYRHAAILAALIPTTVLGAGVAQNENLVVYAPDEPSESEGQRFAELVLERASTFRSEFSKQWLGEELASGTGQTAIYIDFSTDEDRGLTWAKDHPGRLYHNIYLTTSAKRASGSTLRHELVHAILATRYPHPHRLPEWIEEGIACRYDDEDRVAGRKELFLSWVRTGQAPRLIQILETSDVRSNELESYAAAASLVSFLLSQGDEHKLLRFAEDGQRHGWSASLQSHYGINDVPELQSRWQTWLASSATVD